MGAARGVLFIAGRMAEARAALTGTAGDDTLDGTVYDDTLSGLAGRDVLDGAPGADLLDGGDDDDSLRGGAGHDTLLGGAGADTLEGDGGDETGPDSGTWDLISGFVRGQDRIDLSGIDANTATAANEAFINLTVGGAWTGAMSGGAGRLYFDRVNGVLYGNTDGDAEAEFAIQLTGLTALSAADLIL